MSDVAAPGEGTAPERLRDSRLRRAGRKVRPVLLGVVGYQILSGLLLLVDADGAGQQVALLVHMGFGAIFLFLLLPYLAYHVPRVRRSPRTAMRLGGLAAVLVVAATVFTGLWMLARISADLWIYGDWRWWHRWLGLTGGGLLLIHLAFASRKAPGREAVREGLFGLTGAIASASLMLGAALWQGEELLFALADPAPPVANRDSEDGRQLSMSGEHWDSPPPPGESCGVAGCHSEIYREWRTSPHGKADSDPYYRALERRLAAGARHRRVGYCNECHDPEMLLTGAFSRWSESGDRSGDPIPHSGQGVSCVTCHAMRWTSGKQQRANYAVMPPRTALAEQSWIGRLLIRAYPGPHKAAYGRDLYASSRLCAGCHLASVSEPVPGFGHIRIENPYQRWELDKVKPLCQDCHMPVSKAPGGSHRMHRFPGSALQFEAEPEQHEAVRAMLAGELPIPNVRGDPGSGPLVLISTGRMELSTASVTIPLMLTERGRIGHPIPLGAHDLAMLWVEARLLSSRGTTMHRWGEAEPGGPLLPGTPYFRPGGFVESEGHLVAVTHPFDPVESSVRPEPVEGERRGLPDGTGARANSARTESETARTFEQASPSFGPIRPGKIQLVQLRAPLPRDGARPAILEAGLWYRKLHRPGLEALGPGADGIPLPLPPRALVSQVRVRLGLE